ncbi:MAG: ABC transporter permease [Thermoplasmata archaeon]
MGIDAAGLSGELPFAGSDTRVTGHGRGRPAGIDRHQFQVAVSSQLQSYFRTSRFWVAFGVVVGLGALFSLVGSHQGLAPTALGYVAGVTTLTAYLAIVTGALFGGDAISTDFGSKTGYYMLPVPVRRSVLLGGRYLAAFLVSLLVMGTFYGIVSLGAIAFYPGGSVPWGNVALAYALVAVLMLGILSFAFALSSMSKSSAFGLVLTIMMLLVVFEILDAVVGGTVGPNYLWFSILYASNTVQSVVSAGLSASGPGVGEALVIMGAYAAGFLGLALVLFGREEM